MALPPLDDVLALWERTDVELLRLRATNLFLRVTKAVIRGELDNPVDRAVATGILRAIDLRAPGGLEAVAGVLEPVVVAE